VSETDEVKHNPDHQIWVYFVNPFIPSSFIEECIKNLLEKKTEKKEDKEILERLQRLLKRASEGLIWWEKIDVIRSLVKVDKSATEKAFREHFKELTRSLINELKNAGVHAVSSDVLLPNGRRDEILIMLRCQTRTLADEYLMTVRYRRDEPIMTKNLNSAWIYEKHVALRKGENFLFEDFGFPVRIRIGDEKSDSRATI